MEGAHEERIDELLKELEGMPRSEVISRLMTMASDSKREIGKKTIDGVYRDLFTGPDGKKGVDRIQAENSFEVFSEKRHADAFIDIVGMKVKMKMKGETDEPVTSDIKRLIRLPSSLHGKTGFRVVPLEREELDEFNPFRDAVPEEFGDADVHVALEKPVEFSLRDRSFSLEAGKCVVPEYAAVFLVCRRQASIESR
jgi:DNA primase small subunit